MSDQIVAPRTRDLDVLRSQLAPWLESNLPGAKGLVITDMDYPRGAGRSHETILFDAQWTDGGQERNGGFVVRIKPDANQIYPDDLFQEQYRAMRVLHELDIVPVAETFGFEEDPDFIGASFFVMAKLNGRVAVSFPPYRESGWVAEATPAQRRKCWENGVRNLALIQKVPLDRFQFLAGPEGARSGLEQEWDKYDRFVEWISQDKRWPILDAAREALRARWPDNRPAGLVWGDARLGNLMFDENCDVLAVMDWEQASLGGALNDLAWWVHMSSFGHEETQDKPHLEGMGTRAETIALWQEVTGISVDDLDWYLDFTVLKTSCLSVTTSQVWGWPEPDHASLARQLKL
ncbi:MAG: phosphotransferase family protein [Novosphingobium sp.]|nr:phosphotransferase family protein [Novosphingobium sp.]